MFRVYPTLAMLALACGGCGDSIPAERASNKPATVRVSDTRPVMGVRWTITVHAPDPAGGDRAIAAGFAEAERLDRILSDYDPGSELARLSAAAPTPEPVAVGDDLWNVLVRAAEIHRLSDGAFDITVGPLTTLWRQARRSGRLPLARKLATALAAVGGDAVVLDPEVRTARLTRPGMRLDAGGIGMGYAADRVLATLAGCGISAAMVDASGDVVVSGPPPGEAGWKIRMRGMPGDDSAEPLVVHHGAVTTSGDAAQFVDIDGRRYSHVVDPRTGLGVAGPAAVTVIAPDGATADAVATAASVLGPAEGPAVVSRIPGAAARFIWEEDGVLKTAVTPGWPRP